jgi:hypothetical protein
LAIVELSNVLAEVGPADARVALDVHAVAQGQDDLRERIDYVIKSFSFYFDVFSKTLTLRVQTRK